MNAFDIIISMIESFIYTMFYSYFFTGTKQKKIISSLTVFGMIFAVSFFMNGIGYSNIITVIIEIILVSIFSKQNIFSSIAIATFPDLITAIINSILSIIFSYLFFQHIDFDTLMQTHGMWITILSKVLQAVIFIVSAKYIDRIIRKLQSKEMAFTSLSIILQIIVIDSIETLLYLHEFNSLNLAAVIIAEGMQMILLIMNLNLVIERSDQEKQSELQRQLLESQIHSVKTMIASEEELHMLKHDVQHMLNALDENEKTKKIQESLNTVVIPFSSSCKPIDTVLNIKREQAARKGIDMVCVLNIIDVPDISEDDLYIMLINLLDNSIEHCGIEKKIHLEIKCSKDHFYLKIQNPVDQIMIDDQGEFIVQKKKGHGYGIKTIKTVVKKYNGILVFQQVEYQFIVSISI